MWEDDVQRPFGGWPRYQGDLWTAKKSKDQKHAAAIWFWPLKLKQSGPQKGTIKRPNTLFADRKTWSQSQTLNQVMYKWLPLAVADWISGNDRCLARCGWLFYAGEQVNPAKSGCPLWNAGELEGVTLYGCFRDHVFQGMCDNTYFVKN